MDVEGGGVPSNLTQWEMDVYAPPVWSPDGRFIAFVGSSEEGPPHIWVAEVESGQLFQLTRRESGDFFPAWQP